MIFLLASTSTFYMADCPVETSEWRKTKKEVVHGVGIVKILLRELYNETSVVSKEYFLILQSEFHCSFLILLHCFFSFQRTLLYQQ